MQVASLQLSWQTQVMSATGAQHSAIRRILMRFIVNVGIVLLLSSVFPAFFVLQGGPKAAVFVGLILTFLNAFVVPVLRLLAFPIQLFAWIVAFFLVNAGALYLAREIVSILALPGVSLTIGGGAVGWISLSLLFGFSNWLVRAMVR